MPSAGITSFERRRQRLLWRRRFAGRMLKAIGFRRSPFWFRTIQVCPKDLPIPLRQADDAVNWPAAS